MTIVDAQMYTVRVPARPNSWQSAAYGPLGWDETPIVILRLRTDSGVEGIGEVERGIAQLTVRPALLPLIGLDPLAINLQELPLGDAPPGVAAAIEMAVLDLVGKQRGMPAAALLGGLYRRRVPVALVAGRMAPRDTAILARAAVEGGYRALSLAATTDEPLPERLAAVRTVVGDQLRLMVDLQGRGGPPAAVVELARRLEPVANLIEVLVDPVERGNFDWYRLLRGKLHLPLALRLHEPRPVIEAIKAEAIDYLGLGGGLFAFHRLATASRLAGLPCWYSGGLGLGISEAAALQAVAASAGATLPSELAGERVRSDDLIVRPLAIADGQALVPDEPGLGVTLDEEALERYGIRDQAPLLSRRWSALRP